MPGKTGFDLAKEILSIRKDVPIILCSGYAGAVSKGKIEEAGINSFIMKPVTVEALSKKIQQLLK
jgi:CheY-like chemotaxis protein